LVVAATACKSTVDNGKLEQRVRERVRELGVNVTRISCPDGVRAIPGEKFACQVEIEGKKTYTLDFTVRDVDALVGKGRLESAWHDGVAVRVAHVQSAFRDTLSASMGVAVAVACGDEPLRLLDRQRKLRCEVVAGDAKATLTIEFDEHVNPGAWQLDPALVVPSKMVELMTPLVRAKTNPLVELDCGPARAFPRPTDGIVWCALTDGAHHARLKLEVDAKLDLQRWSVVPAPL
jgi:hypothetical protein